MGMTKDDQVKKAAFNHRFQPVRLMENHDPVIVEGQLKGGGVDSPARRLRQKDPVAVVIPENTDELRGLLQEPPEDKRSDIIPGVQEKLHSFLPKEGQGGPRLCHMIVTVGHDSDLHGERI